jgi:hypothetical protein
MAKKFYCILDLLSLCRSWLQPRSRRPLPGAAVWRRDSKKPPPGVTSTWKQSGSELPCLLRQDLSVQGPRQQPMQHRTDPVCITALLLLSIYSTQGMQQALAPQLVPTATVVAVGVQGGMRDLYHYQLYFHQLRYRYRQAVLQGWYRPARLCRPVPASQAAKAWAASGCQTFWHPPLLIWGQVSSRHPLVLLTLVTQVGI